MTYATTTDQARGLKSRNGATRAARQRTRPGSSGARNSSPSRCLQRSPLANISCASSTLLHTNHTRAASSSSSVRTSKSSVAILAKLQVPLSLSLEDTAAATMPFSSTIPGLTRSPRLALFLARRCGRTTIILTNLFEKL